MTNNKTNGIDIDKKLTETQLRFLAFCKQFGWGKIEVTVVRGEPVASKELEKTYRHDA